MSLFVGITFLSTRMHLVPLEQGESILSQMTRQIAGSGILYYWVQIFTALILFLAANTGYQDFPRLSSFLAKDGFLPRWMQNRGDRLVYSGGILVLAVVSSLIVIIFSADEIAMLPLYALGVMLSFTLSQAGMSRLMGKVGRAQAGRVCAHRGDHIHYERRWRWKRGVNVVGAITTGVVFIILAATKFVDGAWIVVLHDPVAGAAFRPDPSPLRQGGPLAKHGDLFRRGSGGRGQRGHRADCRRPPRDAARSAVCQTHRR